MKNKTIKNNTSFAIDPPKLLIRQRKYQKGEKSTFDFFSKAIGLGEKFSLVNKLTDCNSKKQRRICQRYIVQQFFGFGTFLASECITYQPSTYTWFETTQDLCGQTLATKRSHLPRVAWIKCMVLRAVRAVRFYQCPMVSEVGSNESGVTLSDVIITNTSNKIKI